MRDYLPATAEANYREYQYTPDNRLMRAGGGQYSHDERGFRSIWSDKGVYTLYEYSPDYRLLKAEEEDRDKAFTYAHDEDGQRVAKYLNGELVEAYQWLDFVRLAAFYDGHHQYEFAYRDGERTPFAMRRDDGAVAGLFYDQVGSLRVVADMDDNVIKEVLYDPFGGIIEDTNPDLRLPLGFAGGLHDRGLGFVRFGWRDYDVRTGRWTAPDPIGEKGGDPDWYGYCLDDPVNGVDPAGLFSPFSQEQKDGLKQVMKDKLDDFGAFTNYPLDLFGCFPACHDMKEKKKELSEPPRKSGGADREIRTKKPEDITHVGTWWENVTKGLF